MADLDKLSISIEANTRGASNQIGKLTEKLSVLASVIEKIDTSKFEGLANATNSLASGLSALKGSSVKQLVKAGEALENIKGQGNAFDNIVDNAETLGDNAEKATADVNGLRDAIQSGGRSTLIETVNKDLDSFSEKAVISESSVKGLKKMLASLKIIIPTQELDRTQKKFESLKLKAQELKEQIEYKSKTVDGYIDSKTMESDKARLEGLINEIERLKLKKEELESHGGFTINTASLDSVKKVLSNISSTLTTVSSKVLKFVGTFAGIPWAVNSVSNAVKKLKKHFDNLGKSFARIYKMARLMLVRKILQAVIKNAITGFTNLIQYSGKFDASVSLLWNSMRQLGNSVAAAVAPLINALAPALNMIIQLCIKAVNAVNQLISALMGNGTWTKAKTLSDDYAKSLDKSTDNAKALKKTILGFDEINKLDDNTDSKSGGITPPTDMFEESNISNKWKDFANKLKGMWEDADFSELGSILGQKLKDGLDSIPWVKVKESARKLGKSLATLINGFIETEGLGVSIGNTLAQAINTAFSFLNGFVHNLNWKSVGTFIADIFNGFFENIDWVLIKDTIVTGFRGLAESINSFIKRFNWDNISNTIGNAVNTLTEAVYTFFSRVDFHDLGFKLGEQLRKTIEKIDWQMLGSALGSIIRNAIDFVKGFLDGSDGTFDAVKNAISDLFKGFFEQVSVGELATIIASVVAGAIGVSVGKLIINAAVKKAGERILKAVFGSSATEVVAKSVEESVGKSVEKAAISSKVTSAASSLGSKIAIGIATAIGGYVVGNKIGEWLASIFSPDDVALYEHYSGIQGMLLMLKDTASALAYEIGEAWTKTKNNIETYKNVILAYWETIKQKASDSFNKMSESSDSFKTKASQNFEDFKSKCSEVWEGIKKFGTDSLESIEETATKITDSIRGSFANVWEDLKKGFSNVIDFFKDLWNGIADGISGDYELLGHEFKIELPKFAMGGFPEDGLFMANHGEMVGKFSNGKTAVANNEQITDGIAKAVYSAIMNANASSGSGNVPYINNTIQVDGETIARAVTKGQQSLNRRYNPSGAY